MKKIYRPKQGRIFCGVCIGIANYFNIDPVLIRIIFVGTALFGWGILFYIILCFIIPEEGSPEYNVSSNMNNSASYTQGQTIEGEVVPPPGANTYKRLQMLGAAILVGLGVLLLLGAVLPWFALKFLWPIVLIGGGIGLLIHIQRQNNKTV